MRNADRAAEDIMTFEFLLIAMIDGQQPITLQQYAQLIPCQEAAISVDGFVNQNYTELKTDLEFAKTALLGELADFNEKWEAVKIPFPSVEETDGRSPLWAEKIRNSAYDASMKALELLSPELSEDANKLWSSAMQYIDDSRKPDFFIEDKLVGFIEPNRIEYFCIATPK
jgi:hypothetical protein